MAAVMLIVVRCVGSTCRRDSCLYCYALYCYMSTVNVTVTTMC